MRNIKLKDTPLRATPEVKDNTNYSRKERKKQEIESKRFTPLTEEEDAMIIRDRPKVKKSWKQLQKEMPPSF
jgi:hypothetical protein